MANNSGKPSAISTAIGILIASVLLFIGIRGVYHHWVQPNRQYASSATWERVPCTVLTVRVDETKAKKSSLSRYIPIVEYRYQHSGKEYTSKRFWFGYNETTDEQNALRLTAPFVADGQYECMLDPSNPADAVLVREINPAPGWLIRNYAVAAGIGAIMMLGQMASILMRCFSGPTVSEKNLIRAMLNSTCPIESGDPDEPLIIQAAESRVAVASGLWIGGLCWMGITSVIASFAWGGKDWFTYLFVVGFLLAGVALLVAAFYTTLQVFNPIPILACSQRDIYPGSEFELSWMFRGNVKKLKKLEIVLEGIEKVSYRQGTTNRTEEKPFFQQQILSTTSSETMSQGFEIVTVPLETMHSFKSLNNSFTWQIRVNGQVPFWPDIRDRFEIVLLAPLPN